MCGIAGWVGQNGIEAGEERVREMSLSLALRGPDGEGLERFDGVVLAHRRLSIFDLSSAGSQPMLSPDGKLAVVFNGAIYNFRELKGELEGRGYQFRSQTDTEVLLHGYREWGIERLLDRMRGMFAIGLWDEERKTLWLMRDRLGVKPLHFFVAHGEIGFASTARALRATGWVSEVNAEAVGDFLQRGYVSDGRSIWQGAEKLRAAELLEWREGEIRSRRQYWQPSVISGPGPSFEEAVEETERLLLQAVKRRLDADVPVGSLLSGGIDSGLVCWAISKLGGDITAFTVGTAGDAGDETEDARLTAKRLGIRHQVIELTSGEAPRIGELIEAYGEPFAVASAMGMLKVSRAVRKEATVLLTGDGGDDVFLGYPEHRACWIAQRLARQVPEPAGPWLRALANGLPPVGLARRVRTLLLLATRGVAGVQQTQDRHGFYRQQGLFGERLQNRPAPELAVQDSLAAGRNLVAEFLDYDRQMRFTGEYMTKVDGGTMRHALEARSPFLDQDLWEFAGRLPVEIRMRGGELKAVLRALARKHLGERTAAGKKRGFTIPVERWMAGDLRPQALAAFEDSALARGGWVKAEAVREQLRAGEETLPVQLWYLFVLENWMKAEGL